MNQRPEETQLGEALRRLARPTTPIDLEERIVARVAKLEEEKEQERARSSAESDSSARVPVLVLGALGAVLVACAQALGLVTGRISLGLPTAPFARAPRWLSEWLAATPGMLEAPIPSSLAVLLIGAGMLLYVVALGAWERRPAPRRIRR